MNSLSRLEPFTRLDLIRPWNDSTRDSSLGWHITTLYRAVFILLIIKRQVGEVVRNLYDILVNEFYFVVLHLGKTTTLQAIQIRYNVYGYEVRMSPVQDTTNIHLRVTRCHHRPLLMIVWDSKFIWFLFLVYCCASVTVASAVVVVAMAIC